MDKQAEGREPGERSIMELDCFLRGFELGRFGLLEHWSAGIGTGKSTFTADPEDPTKLVATFDMSVSRETIEKIFGLDEITDSKVK